MGAGDNAAVGWLDSILDGEEEQVNAGGGFRGWCVSSDVGILDEGWDFGVDFAQPFRVGDGDKDPFAMDAPDIRLIGYDG